ncbi:MAG: histidine kinase [Eubacteriales bacterium]|nr:histidine kinase [Eubacteriales bacterium]
MRKLIKKMTDYARSHMASSLIGTGMALFLSAAFFFQGFLRNEYQQYLLAETRKTEHAVLDASAVNINSMLQDSIMTCADMVVDRELYQVVKNLEAGANVGDLYALEYKLNNIIHSGNIVAVAVVTEQGLLKENGRYWSRSGYKNLWRGENLDIAWDLYEGVMRRVNHNDVICYEASTAPLQHQDFPDMLFFHLAYPIMGEKVKKTENCGVAIFTIKLDAIIDASALSNQRQGGYISEYLSSGDGMILYHTDSRFWGKNEKEIDIQNLEELKIPLKYLDWSIQINIDENQIGDQVEAMFSRGVGVYLLLLLVCIVLWQLLLWRILKPVRTIGGSMEGIRKGDLSEKIEIQGTHELWQLAEQYNYAVDALNQQRRETKREFEEKIRMLEKCNDAEREALESQINAHFLCNTLGAINYSAMENGDTEVSILLKSLSEILHYVFSRETRDVTLGDEIAWVRQYLYLQKYRLMDVFDYQVRFPEEYNEWPCCKLFLQPFVENSIAHGFEGWEKGGRILISGEEKEGRLVIQIRDNGSGMKEEIKEKLQKVLSGTAVLDCGQIGIGISNVAARLRMYYGSEMEIRMETREGEGTCFTLYLPIPYEMLKDSMETPGEEEYD